MSKFAIRLRYTLRTYRLDMLILPVTLWIIVTIVVMLKLNNGVEQVAGGFFGFGLPLVSGILASNAILDIPIIELKFTLPSSRARFLVERQMIIFIIISLVAFSFQLFLDLVQVDLSFMGSMLARQLAWMLPTVLLMSLGCACTLLAAQTTSGAMAVGLIWVIELIAHEWFMQSSLRSRFFIFMGAYAPEYPDLLSNYITLTALFLGFYLLAWFLLGKPERLV